MGDAAAETSDLQDWMTDHWHGLLEDLDPGFYVWKGYFLREYHEYHVDTLDVRPATIVDFFVLGFPLPQQSGLGSEDGAAQ